MASYYYLAAQLPSLVYGQSVPMSSASFRELAKEHLSSHDAAVLDCCTLDVMSDESHNIEASAHTDAAQNGGAHRVSSKFLDSWREWEKTLRINLAKNRAKKLKREEAAAFDAADYPFDAAQTARAALAIESPFEAEVFLDKARWDAVESFQSLDIFSENAIFAYMIKLLLMERRMSFNVEEGFTEYKGLYAAILGEPK